MLPKVRKNPLIEIIPINTGCLNQCTYCKTKHARGELGSYPPEEIIERARQSFTEGVVEIWLTSEDTGMLYLLACACDFVRIILDQCFLIGSIHHNGGNLGGWETQF